MELKIVTKPWGEELWLELNSSYCFKRITIRHGCRTSLQYHVKKLETNYVYSGTICLYLEDLFGIQTKLVQSEHNFFTILPGMKHRIEAITDAVLLEVSTPEVDDVVRVEDDFDRPSGRIEDEHKHQ